MNPDNRQRLLIRWAGVVLLACGFFALGMVVRLTNWIVIGFLITSTVWSVFIAPRLAQYLGNRRKAKDD